MAKTDRNSKYMKETFGTESLITDYGPTPSLTPVPETLDSVLKHLEEILSVPYGNTLRRDGPFDTQNSDKFIEEIIDFGFNSGVRHLAEQLYPKLKVIQNQQ